MKYELDKQRHNKKVKITLKKQKPLNNIKNIKQKIQAEKNPLLNLV